MLSSLPFVGGMASSHDTVSRENATAMHVIRQAAVVLWLVLTFTFGVQGEFIVT